MAEATLRVLPVEGFPGIKRIEVDCEHGTTTAHVCVPPGMERVAFDRISLRVAVAKHYAEEGCDCTASLRKRFEVTT